MYLTKEFTWLQKQEARDNYYGVCLYYITQKKLAFYKFELNCSKREDNLYLEFHPHQSLFFTDGIHAAGNRMLQRGDVCWTKWLHWKCFSWESQFLRKNVPVFRLNMELSSKFSLTELETVAICLEILNINSGERQYRFTISWWY